MKPQISILIPVYNAEKYLAKCLDTCCGQTYTDYEIICIDDGSVDKSLSILRDYAKRDTRVRVLSQENAGVAATRNRLIKEASGKYIAFVDADDWIEPVYLEKLYKAAQEYQADVVRALFIEHDIRTGQDITCDKRYSDYAAKRKEPVTLKQRFQAGLDDSQVWGKLILKELLMKHQISFCTGCVAEDVSFEILLYLSATQIRFIDEYIYYYQVGSDQAITTKKLAMNQGILLNLCFLSDDLNTRGIDSPEIYSYLLQLIINAIRRFKNVIVSDQEDHLFQRAIALIEKHRESCYCWSRWKYGCFVKLTYGQSVRRVLWWSNLFR